MRTNRSIVRSTRVRHVRHGYGPVRALFTFTALLLVSASLHAQAGDQALSREERLKAHRARIEKIIQERRAQEAASAPKPSPTPAPQAGAAPAAGGQPAPAVTSAAPPQPLLQPTTSRPGSSRSEARAMLSFYPWDSSVTVGDTFVTEIIADSRSGALDQVAFTIAFPPQSLNALAFDHTGLDQIADGEIEYGVDSVRGRLAIKAKLKNPQPLLGKTLAKIYWEALKPDGTASLEFLQTGPASTGLFKGTTNYLGTAEGAGDGLVNSTVLIRPRKRTTVAATTKDRGLILDARPDILAERSVQIRLESSAKSARTGDIVEYNVVVDNPDGVAFDRLRLFVQYPTDKLEPVDADTGNQMRRGLNAKESKAFNFDFLKDNAFDTERGWLVFDAGRELEALTASGVVATLKFKVIESGEAQVVLVRNDEGVAPTTDITLHGRSVLVDRGVGLVALSGARIAAFGPTVARTSSNATAESSGSSAVLYSAGLTKDRQFKNRTGSISSNGEAQ